MNRFGCLSVVCGAIVLAFVSSVATADVTLPRVIDNNMVLQRDMDLPIWGWAAPGEEVIVAFAGQKVAGKADEQGRWQVKLAPLKASDKPQEMTVAGKNTIRLENILVGEVWVCSGQSNMGMSVSQVIDAEKELAAADHPNIRLFEAPKVVAPRPTSDVYGRWQRCTGETVKGFTAVGYFFGRMLQKELNVPIGLINTSWGGTRIEPWTPAEAFTEFPKLEDVAEQVRWQSEESAKGLRPLVPAIEAWVKAARAAEESGEALPPLPPLPNSRLSVNTQPTTLYNGMVAGLVPFGIRGAIWYQGESNVGEGMLYLEKMKALVSGWRKAWGQGAFPFYYVQLAPYRYGQERYKLPELWEAQTAALSIPNTGMAVTNDIGMLSDIHPKNKQDVGKRLALWALAKTYGRNGIVYSGPLYKSMTVEGSKIRVRFEYTGSGLASRDGGPLTWFEVAGPDGTFVEAKAEIDGDSVVVSSEEVSEPVGVRFAWSQTAQPNLMNKEGLPAAAFRASK